MGTLFAGEKGREKGWRRAAIFARKRGQLNPPYAGCRDAAGAGYKIREVQVARCSRWHSAVRRDPHPGPPPQAGEGGLAANSELKFDAAARRNSNQLHVARSPPKAEMRPLSRACGGGLGWGGAASEVSHRYLTPPSCGAAPARRQSGFRLRR